MRLQGIADGAATAVGWLFADEHRPETERSEAIMVRFAAARDSVLDALEHGDLDGKPRIGEIAVLALQGYLDFRWPERDWRSGRLRLADWAKLMFKRPLMASTMHSI